MASSFITKDGLHGFWVNDSLLQVVCWGIVKVIDDLPDVKSNFWIKNDFRKHIYNCSQGIFIGFIDLHLDEFITNDNRKELMNSIIDNVNNYFFNKGEFIPIKELNDFQIIKETKRVWVSPLSTQRVLKIIFYLKNLVNDKIETKEDDAIEYDF